MKKIYNSVSLLSLVGGLALLAGGCDDVDENERLIEYPLPEAGKVELIMEFTGQRCSNCPDGAKVIHNLQEKYPENIVAVCLHPEGPEYTRPLGQNIGLRSTLATELYQYYNPPSFPFALFDGQVMAESNSFPQWSTAALSVIENATPAVISAAAEYDASGNVTVDAECDFVGGDFPKPLNIAVWIMENGITGRQLSTTGELRDYVHNHVARASLNGTWGVTLGSSFAFEQKIEYSVSMAADPTWKLENCQAVVFLVEPDSKNVVQTALADLKPIEE